MGLVIDTSALVQLERGEGVAKIFAIGGESIMLPTIVWAEALIGVRLADTPECAARRRGFLERIRLRLELVNFGDDAAEVYADLFMHLRRKGLRMPQNDLQIAALAVAKQFGVLIGPMDEQHYRMVPGLRVEVLG